MRRRMALLLHLLAAGILTLSVAGVATAADTAKVRVLHASPDAPAVDVYLDDTIVDALTNVPFGTISGYLPVPAGDHNVKVYATGTTTAPVIDADVTLAAGASYTIAATGAVASITAQVLQDQPSPDCDGASVRVVHFSADAPAVDIATAGSDPADAVVKNLEYPNATGYVALPAGSYDLEVRLAGTTTVALDLPGRRGRGVQRLQRLRHRLSGYPAGRRQRAAGRGRGRCHHVRTRPARPRLRRTPRSPQRPRRAPASVRPPRCCSSPASSTVALIARRPATRRVRQDQG